MDTRALNKAHKVLNNALEEDLSYRGYRSPRGRASNKARKAQAARAARRVSKAVLALEVGGND